MNQHIPFLDLVTPHRELEEEIVALVRDALRHARFIGGPMVEEFEKEFAAFCGTKHAVGVGSGTDALRFALLAADIRPGDGVITVPYTFIATTEAISQAGAEPLFVDIDSRTYNMNPERLRAFLLEQCATDRATGRTIHRATGRPVTAVIPVHIYGQPAEMDAIRELAEQHRLTVIEDACQAHGAEYYSRRDGRWQKAGSMSAAAAFSFYPGKNLGACGEAGAVTTNSDEIASRIRMIRDHGQAQKYYHDREGYNGRLDAIQAGILSLKLKKLTAGNRQRRDAARRYHELLRDVPEIVLPYEPEGCHSVYHLYVIRSRERAALQDFLSARQIGTGMHYPLPLHLQKAYAGRMDMNGSLAASESASAEILSLPMYPGRTAGQQEQVAAGIRAFAASRAVQPVAS